jgi:two-component system, OmpR family, alkaline phosphatase synthesis response regulator PhoP
MPKILIVDDEPHIRLLLEQTLEDFEDKGVEILTSGNGKEALEIIKMKKPDIIYLDVMMPGINGYDVCYMVKHELKLNVFIVMLTAKGQEFDKKKGEQVGADIYMTKPFNPDTIIEKTSDVLGIKL